MVRCCCRTATARRDEECGSGGRSGRYENRAMGKQSACGAYRKRIPGRNRRFIRPSKTQTPFPRRSSASDSLTKCQLYRPRPASHKSAVIDVMKCLNWEPCEAPMFRAHQNLGALPRRRNADERARPGPVRPRGAFPADALANIPVTRGGATRIDMMKATRTNLPLTNSPSRAHPPRASDPRCPEVLPPSSPRASASGPRPRAPSPSDSPTPSREASR